MQILQCTMIQVGTTPAVAVHPASRELLQCSPPDPHYCNPVIQLMPYLGTEHMYRNIYITYSEMNQSN